MSAVRCVLSARTGRVPVTSLAIAVLSVPVVFGYAHVYRKGRQDDERAVPAGERQQLVK